MTVRVKKARGDDFYVVGVGASAGGLEALSLFFAGIPADTNMAFVVVQHLSEKPKSMLPEILSRKTSLPLSEITGATSLLPGHVYVAPAHRGVTISKNTLNLARSSPKKEHFLPIDFFFSALAREKKENAVGVVLSGTGKDGTEGLLAIRSKGGMTFAENPEAATHAGMPENAIASGAVMHTLSPKKIAGKLSELSKLRASSLLPSGISAEKNRYKTPVLARDYAESIFNTVSEPMLVLGKEFRVERANRAFYKNFEVSKQETEGYLFQKLGNEQWNISEVTDLLNRALSSKTKVVNAFVEHDFPHIGKRIMSLMARRISDGATDSHKKTEKILFIIHDVTKQKGLEAAREREYGEMEENIKDRTRKLREVNAVLMREVVERKRLEEDLRERTKKLEEADQRKNEFLAVLSHELRNPLSPIIASVEAMKLRGTDDMEIQHAFEVIGRHAEQMTRLLKDLLDASKIIYGKIELLPEYVDIREVIHHAIDTADFFIKQRGHTLALALPDEPKYMVIDPFRIEQILANLIFNAAKYTNPGGKIEVILSQEEERGDEKLCIIIKDNGIGIASNILPNIFDLFVQAEGVLKKTKGGIGIGLFLVRRLAELHGGTIRAQSEGSGKGSEFTLCLPVKNNLSPIKKRISSSTKNNVPKRILVADDNKDAADSLGKLLSHLGHTLEIVYSGREALRLAKETLPDMAFIDIAMPEMDGYEVAKRMREDSSLDKTKLVALTGFGQKEDKEKALHAGFDLHYIKPITLLSLKEIVEG